MIKIEKLVAMNFENAIRGARNPMNSWDRSDSYYDENGNYVLGENDLSLAVRLARAGSEYLHPRRSPGWNRRLPF